MEISLAGSLAFMAGLVGRAYNVSGTGLNHYIMLIARTGTGKEAINAGVNRLVEAVAWGPEGVQSQSIRQFIGPSEIASGQGLVKWFERSKSFVSILGEIGITLKRITNENANSHEKHIKKVWLDLYNKSGAGDMLNPTAYSDKDKTGEPVPSPAFSMVGESVPDAFYEALDESMVASGLLPRFTIIEYTGPRPRLNKFNHNAGPNPGLLSNVRALLAKVSAINSVAQFKPMDVPFTDEAALLFDQFNEYADSQMNGSKNNVVEELWNRAHLKAMKLAALISVGIHWNSPVVDYATAQWACNFVSRDIENILSKFKTGQIGGSMDVKQHYDVVQFVNRFVRMDSEEAVRKYKTTETLHAIGIIPWRSLSLGVLQRATFRASKIGATNALKLVVQQMVDSGELRELGAKDKEKFNTSQRCFAISDTSIIRDDL